MVAMPMLARDVAEAQDDALANADFSTRNVGWNGLSEFIDVARREGVTVEVTPGTWSDDMEALVALARAGAGVVLAPDYCAAADLQAGRLLDLLPAWHLPVAEGEQVQAITLPLATAPRSARELVKFVREACAEA